MKTGILVLMAAAGGAALTALFAAPQSVPNPPPPVVAPSPPAPPAAPTQPAPETALLSGKVQEVLQVPGYTYLAVDSGGGARWAAVETVELAVGTTVSVRIDTVLENFKSSALERTFETVVFGRLVDNAGDSSTGATESPHAPGSMDSLHAGLPPTGQDAAPIEIGKVEKAAGGHRIEELYAERKTLEGKTVRVRGVVIKSLEGIMGKTFVHLADGSGSSEAKNDDLTVTTTATPKPGDVVLVEGTLVLEKDIGAGYKYDLLVEQATVVSD